MRNLIRTHGITALVVTFVLVAAFAIDPTSIL